MVDLETRATTAILRTPRWLARLLVGSPKQDGCRHLDPRVQLLLEASQRSGQPRFRDLDVDGARRHYERIVRSGERPEAPLDGEREVNLDGVRARLLHPVYGRRALPFIVYLHGGGFVIGGGETHIHLGRRLARAAGAAVFMLEYPLAPESPFPAAIDATKGAIQAIRTMHSDFAVEPDRGALAGDSAGANIAAVISLDTEMRAQLLYYPTTDASATTGSRRTAGTGFGLEASDLAWFMNHYAPDVDRRDPRLSPRWADNLHASPRTRLVLAGFDPLRDEGRRFGRALQDAGVQIELLERPNWIHGFVHMAKLAGVAEALQEDGRRLGSWLRV